MPRTTTLLASVTLVGTLSSAQADQFFNDDVIVDDKLCVGFPCIDGEVFGGEEIRVKSTSVEILLSDTSASISSDRDWQLVTNVNNSENMGFRDIATFAEPFLVTGGAPNNALFVSSNGSIGFGTNLPARDLHIVDSSTPTIRFEQLGGGFADRVWDLAGNQELFFLTDRGTDNTVFAIEASAPSGAFNIEPNGEVGLGTFNPAGKLHTVGSGVQIMYFESSTGGPVQVRFRTNSENRRFLAVDNANNVQSQIIFRDNDIRFTGETDSGANLWMTVGPNGITSRGPTCNPGPCDATFDPDAFEVPSIEDHAAYMWENQHLWAVGPTSSDEPFNLTQKAGGMLHELEVAHIYIDQLNTHRKAQAELINTLIARIDALEAQGAAQ